MDTKITVVIPAFKAGKTIHRTLSSISMQTVSAKVIISSDSPDDDYSDIVKQYPELDITVLSTDKNTGPGLARQRGLDACKTDWVTFIDADDSFFTAVALEQLLDGTKVNQNVIEVQGTFLQEARNEGNLVLSPRDDVGHPWVFGRLYNVKFLRENKIAFTKLRAMEDGEFNWKIRMTIEGTPLAINILQHTPVYLWRIGSEHSITRIGEDENHIPQYNFDLCQYGATVAAINAIRFCKERNPFNGNIARFTAEMMVGHYFTYVECLERKPVFAKQNFWLAQKFYNDCYKNIEKDISDKVLIDLYSMQNAGKAQSLFGMIPKMTFFEFFDKVRNTVYYEDEINAIRKELPEDIIENDKLTGVLSDSGLIEE